MSQQLIDALKLAESALAIYAAYDEEMTKGGRGLYDSTYSTTHALPVVRKALQSTKTTEEDGSILK